MLLSFWVDIGIILEKKKYSENNNNEHENIISFSQPNKNA